MPAEIRTGTMSWAYDDWKGPFYPAGLSASKMLEVYATVFDTIEIDATFFGVPRLSTVSAWATQVPENFLFAAKVPKAITHERRLFRAEEAAADFGRLMRDHLGPKLGALLLQLPPDLTAADRETFDTFIDGITAPRAVPDLPWVVEFRAASWLETDVARFCAERGVAVATSERLDLGAPLRYVRLLGTENAFDRFDARQIERDDELDAWAKRLRVVDSGRVLVYIRNFFEGHSPDTIRALRRRLGLPDVVPPGRQQLSMF